MAQVDFDETGQVMAEMALSILGEDGGQFAILSASPDAANQNAWIAAMETALEDEKYANLELLEIVYGDDQSEKSYEQAQALISKHPDMELIMAPTSVGIVSAAKALQDEGLCEEIKVSGLGVPAEMLEYTQNGCAPEFALWSFVDLGYLTYYVSYLLATGAIEGVEGETLRGRPPGRVRDHQGPDPTGRRRAARADGSVHRLQHRQRRRGRGIALRGDANRPRPDRPGAAPLPEPSAGSPRPFREAGQLGVGDVWHDGRPPGHRRETAIGTGDHPLAPDHACVPLDSLRNCLGVLDVVGTGVDHARDEHFVGRQGYLGKHRPLVLVARISPLDRETARIHLIDDFQNLGQGHVVVVWTRVVAPADVNPDPVGIDPLESVVEDLDVELDLGSKLGDRCVGKLQMATEGEIGTVDLEDESAARRSPGIPRAGHRQAHT